MKLTSAGFTSAELTEQAKLLPPEQMASLPFEQVEKVNWAYVETDRPEKRKNLRAQIRSRSNLRMQFIRRRRENRECADSDRSLDRRIKTNALVLRW